MLSYGGLRDVTMPTEEAFERDGGTPRQLARAGSIHTRGFDNSVFWLGVGLLIALLCLIDAAATQWEISTRLTHEANPLMAPLVAHGWGWVWACKVAVAAGVSAIVSGLHQSWWGRWLLAGTGAAYLYACGCHAVIYLASRGMF